MNSGHTRDIAPKARPNPRTPTLTPTLIPICSPSGIPPVPVFVGDAAGDELVVGGVGGVEPGIVDEGFPVKGVSGFSATNSLIRISSSASEPSDRIQCAPAVAVALTSA